jgi:hypothetical protein
VDFLETPPAWFRVQASKHFDNPSAASLTPLCHAAAQELYGDDGRWEELQGPITEWIEEYSDEGEVF